MKARLALFSIWILGLTASAVSAETLMMPGRDMLVGAPQVVWGVTTLPNHTTASPTTYAIDFGDGSADATGTVTDRSYLAVTHTFAAAGTFTATLQVTRARTTETATVVLRVFDGTAISPEQADSVDEAAKEGTRIGRASELSYMAADGSAVQWRFESIAGVFEIAHDALHAGTEVFSRYLKDREARSLMQNLRS